MNFELKSHWIGNWSLPPLPLLLVPTNASDNAAAFQRSSIPPPPPEHARAAGTAADDENETRCEKAGTTTGRPPGRLGAGSAAAGRHTRGRREPPAARDGAGVSRLRAGTRVRPAGRLARRHCICMSVPARDTIERVSLPSKFGTGRRPRRPVAVARGS